MKILNQSYELLTIEQRRAAIWLLIFMIIGMILEMLGIGLIVPVIGTLTQEDFTKSVTILTPILNYLGIHSQKSLIAGAMLVLLGIYFIKSLFLSFLAWRRSSFAFGLQAELSQRLFSTYLYQPYTFHLQRNSAQLIRNASTEITMLTGNVVIPTMLIITESLVLLGICIVLLLFEPISTIIITTSLGLIIGLFYKFMRIRISEWGNERQYHEGMRIQHLQQGLGSIKDIKILGCEKQLQKLYNIHAYNSARAGQRSTALKQIPGYWLEFFGIVVLVVLVVVILFQSSELKEIIPTLGLFAAAAFRMIPSANRIQGAMQALRFGLPVIDTLNKEFKHKFENLGNNQNIKIINFQKDIKARNITFTYPDSVGPTIKNISFDIHKGQVVGLIGPSGSGKSTILDLILGLLFPQSGQVNVDGQDISKDLTSWRRHFGYVPQFIYLTDNSIKNNIAFGIAESKIDESALFNALNAAQLSEWVSSLPNGVETVLGEQGVKISGGQRQRVGIARALYHDPDILVLDEATSSLDNETETDVMRSVASLKGNKTIIIVAHRLSTVNFCDHVYRIEQGKIVEKIEKQNNPDFSIKLG